MTRRHCASYWRYEGNHAEGRDCERRNPYGYDLALVSFMAYAGSEGDYQAPLTYQDTQSIEVIRGRSDGFGREIEVRATPDIWDRARQALEALNA